MLRRSWSLLLKSGVSSISFRIATKGSSSSWQHPRLAPTLSCCKLIPFSLEQRTQDVRMAVGVTQIILYVDENSTVYSIVIKVTHLLTQS